MKIACLSDLHGYLPDVPSCDLLILAGDLCPATNHNLPFQAGWLNGPFREWLEEIQEGGYARKVVGVAGNHDWIFQKAPHWVPPDLPWVYLEDNFTIYEGLKIWGSPWQLHFMDWAFNAPKHKGEKFLKEKYGWIPPDTDIIISHGPPKGYGDETQEKECVGSVSLLNRILEIKPKLVVTAHIHNDKGEHRIYYVDGKQDDYIRVINGAYVGEDYQPQGKIQVVEI